MPPFTLWTGSTEVPLTPKQWTGSTEVALTTGPVTPTVVAGAFNSGITSPVSYANPSHQAGDILLLLTESQQTVGLTAPSGWTNVTDSPRAQGTNSVTVNGFWRRCTSGSEANPLVPAATNHQIGLVLRIRGAVATGDPFDFSLGSGAPSTTAITLSGGTTLGAKRLIISVITNGTDTATNQFSSISGPGQTGFTVLAQQFTTNGGGGGLAVAVGEKATAGAVSNVTATAATAINWTGLMMAVKPA